MTYSSIGLFYRDSSKKKKTNKKIKIKKNSHKKYKTIKFSKFLK